MKEKKMKPRLAFISSQSHDPSDTLVLSCFDVQLSFKIKYTVGPPAMPLLHQKHICRPPIWFLPVIFSMQGVEKKSDGVKSDFE